MSRKSFCNARHYYDVKYNTCRQDNELQASLSVRNLFYFSKYLLKGKPIFLGLVVVSTKQSIYVLSLVQDFLY